MASVQCVYVAIHLVMLLQTFCEKMQFQNYVAEFLRFPCKRNRDCLERFQFEKEVIGTCSNSSTEQIKLKSSHFLTLVAWNANE